METEIATFLLSFLIILLAGAGLGLGVLFDRPPPRGSCGGLACPKASVCSGCERRDGAKR